MFEEKPLCIIPARGGSKRIPRKNVKKFLGKPILFYSIDTALRSNLFSKVIVSTDEKEIADLAEKYGAEVPFFRSAKNSNDYASLADVVAEVINEYQLLRIEWNSLCCLLPTSPLVEKNDLVDAYSLFEMKKADAVFSIVKFTYPIQRALKINNEGFVSMVEPQNKSTRSQDLEPCYHDAGQFYFIRTEVLLHQNTLMPERAIPFEQDEMKVQDIDTPADWEVAEIKYKLLQSQ